MAWGEEGKGAGRKPQVDALSGGAVPSFQPEREGRLRQTWICPLHVTHTETLSHYLGLWSQASRVYQHSGAPWVLSSSLSCCQDLVGGGFNETVTFYLIMVPVWGWTMGHM